MSLPRNSLTQEALANDDELVEQLIESKGRDEEESGSSAIRMAEFSPEVEALYGVVDRLGDVITGLNGLGGGRSRRIPPLKRPQTAWDRVTARKDLEQHQSLVRRVLPNG